MLREACNKILHADSISVRLYQDFADYYDEGVEFQKDIDDIYMINSAALKGKRSSGADWTATIRILDFAETAMSVIAEYEIAKVRARTQNDDSLWGVTPRDKPSVDDT